HVVAPADVEPEVPLELLALLRRTPVAPHEPPKPVAQHRERMVDEEERVHEGPRLLRVGALVHQAAAELLLQDRPIRGLLVGTDAHLSLAGRDPLQRLEALAHLLPRLARALLLLLRLDRLELLLLSRRRAVSRPRGRCGERR